MPTFSYLNELVSIIVPCYNSGKTIKQTICSIQLQTWRNIEIIVVDDGSSDKDTIETLDALEGVHLVRQKNSGLPAARNKGFAIATGEYFLPLDADDWLEYDAIEKLILGLKKDVNANFAYSFIQLEGEARGIMKKSYNFFEQLFLNQIPYCILIPKAVWVSAGGYDESMQKGYEDWEFNIRLGALGYIGHVVEEPLFHYRVTSNGMLVSKSNRIHCLLWKKIQKKHFKIYQFLYLINLWKVWKKRASKNPLPLYFVWFIFCRFTPLPLSSILFRWFRGYSYFRRVNK